jgi:hypothetical protein
MAGRMELKHAAGLSLAMGVVLILGGPIRISAPSYEAISNLGGCYVWGSVYLLIGAILAGTDSRRVLRWALLAGAVAYAMLSVAFIITAFRYPTSNLTAIVVYGAVASFHAVGSERVRRGMWLTLPPGRR